MKCEHGNEITARTEMAGNYKDDGIVLYGALFLPEREDGRSIKLEGCEKCELIPTKIIVG